MPPTVSPVHVLAGQPPTVSCVRAAWFQQQHQVGTSTAGLSLPRARHERPLPQRPVLPSCSCWPSRPPTPSSGAAACPTAHWGPPAGPAVPVLTPPQEGAALRCPTQLPRQHRSNKGPGDVAPSLSVPPCTGSGGGSGRGHPLYLSWHVAPAQASGPPAAGSRHARRSE